MPSIPLGLGYYKRTDLAPSLLANMYYEAAPTNLEDQVALIPRARLKAFAKSGAGPIRGLYRKGGVLANVGRSGAIIALSADKLYRVTQTGVEGTGTSVLIDTVEGDFRMSAEGNADVVVLTAGSKVYTTDGATLTQIDFPDGKIVSAVDTLNSYFLFASELGRFYWSAIGGTSVSALDYATAESQPDVLISLKVIGDELWLFGRLSIEVWQPTGDLDLPFQRIGGRIFGIGITARDTCQKFNVNGTDTVCWLGTDRRVYRTDPNPVRISDEALEERLARIDISTTNNATNPYATTDSWNGHDFYTLHIPGEGSFTYDLATGKWDERTSYGQALYRANSSAVGPNAQPLVGDAYSNQIWEMVVDQTTDGDDPVVFEFSGLLENSGAPIRCNTLSLELAPGTDADPSDDPMMQLAVSDDLGRTWDEADAQSLGRTGEYETHVAWTRLGMLSRPGRVHRWRTTLPVTVRKAKYNESLR